MSVKRRFTALRLVILISVVLALPASAYGHGEDPHDGKAIEGLTELASGAEGIVGAHPCVDGHAGGVFPCENVDLLSFVPTSAFGGGSGNDVWGWVDPLTGREYAIMGTSNGVGFVDVTDARNPEVVGYLPTQSLLVYPLWRDVKVYQGHAFIVSEYLLHGLQVFDLTRLRGTLIKPAIFTADVVYDRISNAHNIWINEETGYAYAVGSNTCRGGLHMIDVRDPKTPTFAGCFDQDGYTHDVECVVYDGPDGHYRGREICFASNEDTVTIVDVTDKQNPVQLSRTGYPQARYTHQGSLTPDQRWFLFGDELDEQGGTTQGTATYILDVSDLDAPPAPVQFDHGTESIDHNLYVHGSHVYQSNYTAGLRILTYDKKSLRAGQLTEVAHFDVFPAADVDQYGGTWSNYLFPSGNVAVSGIESGLFMLKPNLGDSGPGQGKGQRR